MTRVIRRVAQGVSVAGVIGLLILLVWKIAFASSSEIPTALERGDTPRAPLFELELLDGKRTFSLSSLRGKVAVINWWATWCGPCREEMPLLQEASELWRERGVVFVGINAQDLRSDAVDFLEEVGVTYPNVYDGKGSTVGRYGLTGYPETYFISSKGNVVYRIAGPVDSLADLDAGIRRALSQS